MPNRVLNSTNILYTPNIEDVKNYNMYAFPNTFVVSSYVNTGTYIGFTYYSGISYELYYIDPDKNVQQLTYNMVPGNGLSIDNNKFEIKLDNETLKPTFTYLSKNYIKVDMSSFKEASAINRGTLSIKNGVYYNDKYYNIYDDEGAFIVDGSNRICLSNGLYHELNEISRYYDKCIDIIKKINNLYSIVVKDLDVSIYVEVGDILYYNSKKKIYTLSKTNKDGSINQPEMVCVIASNVMPDYEPRFMPIKRKMNKYVYDKSNSIHLKNTFNSIPIYSTYITEKININTSIKSSFSGHIAVKRNDWSSNIINPLDSSENYYTINTLDAITNKIISGQSVNWYVDAEKIDYNNNYNIKSYGVYTDIIDSEIRNQIGNGYVYTIIIVKFSNGLTKYYFCNLKLDNNRLVNINTLYGYNYKNTITNNITNNPGDHEKTLSLLAYGKISENEPIIEIKHDLSKFVTLKDINITFDDNNDINGNGNNNGGNNFVGTYILSNDDIVLTNTSISIQTLNCTNTRYAFQVKPSVDGTISIVPVMGGKLNISSLWVKGGTYSSDIVITNDKTYSIYTQVNIYLKPDNTSKYKSSQRSITVSLSPTTKSNTNTNTNNKNSILGFIPFLGSSSLTQDVLQQAIQSITNNNTNNTNNTNNSSISSVVSAINSAVNIFGNGNNSNSSSNKNKSSSGGTIIYGNNIYQWGNTYMGF